MVRSTFGSLSAGTFQHIVDRLNQMLDREHETAPHAWIGMHQSASLKGKDQDLDALRGSMCTSEHGFARPGAEAGDVGFAGCHSP